MLKIKSIVSFAGVSMRNSVDWQAMKPLVATQPLDRAFRGSQKASNEAKRGGDPINWK
jgi:hypothetical protein